MFIEVLRLTLKPISNSVHDFAVWIKTAAFQCLYQQTKDAKDRDLWWVFKHCPLKLCQLVLCASHCMGLHIVIEQNHSSSQHTRMLDLDCCMQMVQSNAILINTYHLTIVKELNGKRFFLIEKKNNNNNKTCQQDFSSNLLHVRCLWQ